jgi:hypothetical protein
MVNTRTFNALLAGALGVAASTLQAATPLPTGTGWIDIPNTKLRAVCAAEQGFGSINGVEGCSAITEDWSGAAFDTKRNRMIIWGGGHNGYYGNELYSFDLANQRMVRLNDPGLPKAPDEPCVETVAGNQPNSRHTYDGLEYIASVDKFYAFGGSRACLNGYASNATWIFDFATMKWTQVSPSGGQPDGDVGMLTGYDPATGRVLVHDRNQLYAYDATANSYTQLSQNGVALGWDMSATYDPKRKKFLIVGFNNANSAGAVYTYTVGAPNSANIQTFSTSGGSTIVNSMGPGLEYDPVSDRIIGWTEKTPNVIYSLNMDTGVWTTTTYSGGPAPTGNGTYGRLRFSAESGVFVLMNKVDDNVKVLRLSNTPVVKPNPPSNVTAQ